MIFWIKTLLECNNIHRKYKFIIYIITYTIQWHCIPIKIFHSDFPRFLISQIDF